MVNRGFNLFVRRHVAWPIPGGGATADTQGRPQNRADRSGDPRVGNRSLRDALHIRYRSHDYRIALVVYGTSMVRRRLAYMDRNQRPAS